MEATRNPAATPSAPAAPAARAPRAGLLARRQKAAKSRYEDAPAWWGVMAWVIGLIAFFPVFYMVITGFKSEADAVNLPPQVIPFPGNDGAGQPAGSTSIEDAPTLPSDTDDGGSFWFVPTLDQYRAVVGQDFFPFFRNSAIAALGSTALVMVLAVPAAYGLAIWPVKKWKDVLFFFISTKFLPAAGVIVPLFVIYSPNGDPELFTRGLGLLGTMRGLIILYTAMNLPIAIWMLRSFFEEVPRDVLDAARIDGANIWQEVTQVMLPMVTPGIAATAFLGIIFAWNEFFFAISLTAAGTSTVPIFMVKFVTSEGLFWAKLAASATMAATPIVLVGWIAQRQLVRGLSLGAVK
ncbi:MAG: carbohydrate ABC transporter permease [Chloroflexota bacterium]|nr:carbohydrate ABC transporter permease [Chloroflexota bacterium]MDQ3513056.1 carbohydrate ABC transporter permease [Chloroflexota bacterium]